eukprot:TRINITY_DN769_c0_g4_i1.p1 TRINITY_DN769_c0_g4~~TRINITY_DN769_c0_g4_i1.p1  ORF type:complete len:532 (+),score=127.04 TRINITY_DN769_c0_g4_i1:369-1964(+)
MRDTFGYKLNDSLRDDWDLCWIDLGITPDIVAKMKPYQKINHFPNTFCLSQKDQLGINLSRMYRSFREEYEFFPQTWILPGDWNCMKADVEKGINDSFIVKPEGLSQGKGIFLTKGIDSINPNEYCVVQRYLENPYLIDGLKFDLRIYTLVYGCDPLRIYVFEEGLVRLSTEKYVKPDIGNIQNQYIHLTNYAINKNSEKFVYNSDANSADVGHKRSLAFVWDYIDRNGGNSKALQNTVHDMIIKTFCAVQPKLRQCMRACQPTCLTNDMCFEILGIDVLIDTELKPWLLEINHAPSFNTDTPFDLKVKSEVLTDAIRLLNLDPENKAKYLEKEAARNDYKAHEKAVFDYLTEKEKDAIRQDAMAKRDKYEMEHCGGFTRIYPNESLNAKYQMFIDYAQAELDQSYKPKPRLEITQPVVRPPPLNSYHSARAKLPPIKTYKSITARKEPKPFVPTYTHSINSAAEKTDNAPLHEPAYAGNSRLVCIRKAYLPRVKKLPRIVRQSGDGYSATRRKAIATLKAIMARYEVTDR